MEYRLGRFNVVADALSRRDGDSPLLAVLPSVEPELAAVSVPTFQLFADIRHEVAESADLRVFRDAVLAGAHGQHYWVVQDASYFTKVGSLSCLRRLSSRMFSSWHIQLNSCRLLFRIQ